MATIDELRARAGLIAEEQQIGGNTAERVGEAFDMVADIIEAVAPGDEQAVLYNPQSPNEAQKAQARANIGAQETISDIADYVKVSAQTFTAAQKQQARENIGAEQAGGVVKNLAGSASDTETRIKAANNPNLQANIHLSGNNIYVNGIAGGIDLDNNGVNLKAGNSGYPNADVKVNGEEVATKPYVDGKVDDRATSIEDALALIEAVIPSQASAQNQLADKNFVNSSISSSTANFVGTFNSLADLQAVQNPTNNDYGFVIETDAVGNEYYDRYKYNGTAWLFEYKVESTPFTAAQWAAIQSGITSALVTKLSALPTNAELTTSLNAKADKSDTYTKAQVDASLDGKQATLVSGQNIATINGNNLLNGGNIVIEGGGGGSADAVLYTEQTLTDEQKAQARTNIGAQTSMTIGTTTTVQPGVDASVANSGTAQEPILDFFIPKGEKGDTGSVVVTDGVAQIAIVNDLTTGGTGDALSAEQGKVLETELTSLKQTLKPIIGGTDAMGEAVKSTSKKYVTSAGDISNSSTATMVVAFYEIPDNISRIDISIPKTGNSSTRPVSFADSTSQTSGLSVYSGGGNAGTQTYTVLDWGEHPYLVINFNSAEGNPTITVETGPTDVTQWVTRDEIAGYTKEDDLTGTETPQSFDQTLCTIGGTYIKKTDGSEYQYSGFQCSDFLRILGSELVVTSNYTLTNAALVAFYTMDKTFISAIDGTTAYTAESFAVPSNAAYMRLTKKSSTRLTIATTATGAKAVLAAVLDMQGGEPVKTLNVLWIGNSFTMNSLTYISDILANTGVSGVTIRTVTRGGAGFQWYSENFSSATYAVNTVVGETITLTDTLSNILGASEYDVVLIQQVSADADNYTTYIPYLADLINQIKVASLNHYVKVGLAMAWGTYESTFASIVAATQQVEANHQSIDYFIPLGTAIESARNSPIAEGNNGFSSDSNIWHLAEGFGRYVAGCLFYECVISPWSGIHIAADTTTTVAVSGNLGEVAVTDQNRGEAQTFAMRAAVLKYTPVAIS